MKHSIPMLVVVLLFIAVFSVSAMSARSFEDIVNSRPAGFNPDQWGVGSYDGALADAAKWNNDIDGINQAACQAEGQPDKLKDECDKKKLSQVNAKEGGTGTDQGIEPLKDNVKEDLKKTQRKVRMSAVTTRLVQRLQKNSRRNTRNVSLPATR